MAEKRKTYYNCSIQIGVVQSVAIQWKSDYADVYMYWLSTHVEKTDHIISFNYYSIFSSVKMYIKILELNGAHICPSSFNVAR